MLLPGRHILLPLTMVAAVGSASALFPRAHRAAAEAAVVEIGALPVAESPGGPAYGTYAWPVRGEVLRPYDPPETPFGSGHRGIDIAAPLGTPIRAAQDGVVAFAGPVAGALFVSVDHPDGVRTTYSWLSRLRARAGDRVDRGTVIGLGGPGHPGVDPPHLHFGARFAGDYLDPMLLLGGGSLVGLVRLAPLEAT